MISILFAGAGLGMKVEEYSTDSGDSQRKSCDAASSRWSGDCDFGNGDI